MLPNTTVSFVCSFVYSNFMYMSIFHACISVRAWSHQRSEDGIRSHGARVTGDCESLKVDAGS